MTRWYVPFLALAVTTIAWGASVEVKSGRAAAASACAVESPAFQPRHREVATAMDQVASGQPRDGYPGLPPLKVGSDNPQLAAAAVPCVLIKAIAYVESTWRQAPFSVPQGTYGPALISPSCGYGVMQVTWGMRTPDEIIPYPSQYRIASDYRYNIAWGTRMLADRWNATPGTLPPIGDRNPAVIENWYYAVWSYNTWSARNNPNNPDLPWPRPAYNGTQSRLNYPYQELVWGLAASPPKSGGVPLWDPVALTLPHREDVGLTPQPLPAADPAHTSACTPPPASAYTISVPWLTRTRR